MVARNCDYTNTHYAQEKFCESSEVSRGWLDLIITIFFKLWMPAPRTTLVAQAVHQGQPPDLHVPHAPFSLGQAVLRSLRQKGCLAGDIEGP